MKKAKGREFWTVTMRDFNQPDLEEYYYVFAKSAADAEQQGIDLMVIEDDTSNPYCIKAKFMGYVC